MDESRDRWTTPASIEHRCARRLVVLSSRRRRLSRSRADQCKEQLPRCNSKVVVVVGIKELPSRGGCLFVQGRTRASLARPDREKGWQSPLQSRQFSRQFDGMTGFRIEDTLRLSFRDDLFLPSLTPETALDYLRISPFWSPTCLNERLIEKHLRQTPENLRALGDAEEEFIVGASHPPLMYVIYKQKRVQNEVTVLAIFYILEGTIYQAPPVHTVFTSRVARSLHHARLALKDTMEISAMRAETSGQRTRSASATLAGVATQTAKQGAVTEAENIILAVLQRRKDKEIKKEENGAQN